MGLLIGRCFLVLLLVGEYPDRLAAEMGFAPHGITTPAGGTRFVPIALRYREEAVRSIARQPVPQVAHHPEADARPICCRCGDAPVAAASPLPALDPVYAFRSLRP